MTSNLAHLHKRRNLTHTAHNQVGDDVPPSSTAVQLISKVTIAQKSSPQVQSDELQRLTTEVSDFENSAFKTDDPELRICHVHKLIYVLSRAVLERIGKNDLSIKIDELVCQAGESLDLFNLNIEASPTVLTYTLAAGECFQSRGTEPLWAWLFPRVLCLLGHPKCSFLAKKIQEFFKVSFQSVNRSLRLWNLGPLFFEYLKQCVSNSLALIGENKFSHIKIVLPSKEVEYTSSPENKNGGLSNSRHTYIIKGSHHCHNHVGYLLLILASLSDDASRPFATAPIFQDYLVWFLDSVAEAQKQLNLWQTISSFFEASADLHYLLLCSIQTLLSNLRGSIFPVILRKGYSILSFHCAEILRKNFELSETVLTSFFQALLDLEPVCRQYDTVCKITTIHLIPALKDTMGEDKTASALTLEMKTAYDLLSKACSVQTEENPGTPTIPSSCQNFGNELKSLRLDIINTDEKRKLDVDLVTLDNNTNLDKNQDILLDALISELYTLLQAQKASNLNGLCEVIEGCYINLSAQARCKVIECLTHIPCVTSGQLMITREREKIKNIHCSMCEGKELIRKNILDIQDFNKISNETIRAFSKIVKSSVFLESKRARVLAMIAVRKVAIHFGHSEFLDLEVSELAQWCFQSLTSSIRELRVTASRTVIAFLKGSQSDPIIRKNRNHALDILRRFPSEQGIHLQETCVLTWGQIGRIVLDDELNLVLLALVQYLGHSNPIISGVAYNEILRLAKALDLSVLRLFSPFWGTVAIEAVRNLIVKPTTTQLVADLLQITVSEFLLLTQSYTIPWLVMGKKVDVIQRISEARKDSEIGMACAESSNLVPTLALLMTQDRPDIENYIMSHLRFASPRFKNTDLEELMRVEPASQALHLLKAAGEAHDDKKKKIYVALGFLAERAPIPDSKTKITNPIGAFLEQHILGLITNISAVIIDTAQEQLVTEKKRNIKALEELVKVAKSYSRVGRPQICACLQLAMSQKNLQAQAFSAWATMLTNLDDEDVESMLESTFSTIIQHWESLDDATQCRIEDALQYLLRERSRNIRNMLVNLPSLSTCARLQDIEDQLKNMRTPTDIGNGFQIFIRRLGHENPIVVTQTLNELKDYLYVNQSFIQASAISEQPDVIVSDLVRSILDTCVKFNSSDRQIALLSAECIGLIGCVDSNRVESVRKNREMVVISNFEDEDETLDFVLFILQKAILPAFLSATDTVLQGFMSYVMQELLEICRFKEICAPIIKNACKDSVHPIYLKWISLPGTIQDTLTPFLTSKYSLKTMETITYEYPIFQPEKIEKVLSNNRSSIYVPWLRNFVLNLLETPLTQAAKHIFPPLCRAIRIKDLSIASFLLPYLILHVIVAGDEQQRQVIGSELLAVLTYKLPADSNVPTEDLKLCIEIVFRVLDYLAKWIQEKQNKKPQSLDTSDSILRIRSVIQMISPEIISDRAVECKSYSRALFYWEQHIRDIRRTDKRQETKNALFQRFQDIYNQIDEPDGIEGISAHLHVLDIDQQILGHRRAGRWTAVQSWYDIKFAEQPSNINIQLNILTCLKESGQHDALLNYVQGMHKTEETTSRLLPFATESSWVTSRWDTLEKYINISKKSAAEDFNISIGRILLTLKKKELEQFRVNVKEIREQISQSLSTATTSSFSTFHDTMLKLHVLTELEMISGTENKSSNIGNILRSLNDRIEVLGAYLNDKQYLLGIRRAAMQLSSLNFSNGDIAASWLTSARLARRGNASHQSYNSVLHASKLGDESATIEHARLLWRDGHHRKATQSLQGAIESNAFMSYNKSSNGTHLTGVDVTEQQNLLTARAHLLLAKWLDSAGQTQSSTLRTQYQLAARTHTNWEKGHYYLGRHYNKLLETEKKLAPELQNEHFLIGEMAKLVIENYLRSLSHGAKYIYQTLPRILTLWLELGTQVIQPPDIRYGNSKEFINRVTSNQKKNLEQIHSRIHKYSGKLPAYVFYTALPQIVARIAHPNQEVFNYLAKIIYRVVEAHPQQAMWTLLAVCQSKQQDRKARGMTVLQYIRAGKKSAPGAFDVKALIKNGERITNDLLHACEAGNFHGNRTIWCSLSKDLKFNSRSCLPSLMAVPVESVLTATLPILTENVRKHKAFSRDVVTINSFSDEVMVLSSLQKPRKLIARGSDGRNYGIMCKPKDDLRKDQRLMEFNGMINRSLKRDAESSRRQLYIKTYAVTPLNEECGIIEWVDGLKTSRDILLQLYKAQGISPNYKEIEALCEEACKGENKISIFTEGVLGVFPPVMYKWFVSQFPEPSAWFAARLRYTRSCAVMSMVGTILGLGDRHGENILFEEGNGGTFHVDFNCLFEKGLTFAKPERVPFRLTHNMVDAMGVYGYEGPFRKSSELTLKLLRQHEETLMTILEAFIYDPTLDLLSRKSEKKKKVYAVSIPDTAQGVLNSIQRKVRGLLPGESVPLGVEGQVDELINQATNPTFLAGMYIGWCSFL
ncbi:Protein kinase rad3 [Golovinomyces cichoracearum]|uniref:non-specific serine/threonine protein kinase n=1 Tax=Golovinomyces cichoracearum TaxID=62708 RepID=A0A420HAT7_9PEZI|nr:Protein kinase rad3 [Golovinomyces cichoracearum]